jgi:hypothetical protein
MAQTPEEEATCPILKDTLWICVLNDDSTYTGLSGCWIAPTPDEDIEALDDGAEPGDLKMYRYSIEHLLNWPIDHGYIEYLVAAQLDQTSNRSISPSQGA